MPQYIPHIFQILKRSKHKELEDTSAEALLWCRKNSIPIAEVLKKISGLNNYKELDELFPDYMNYAKEKESSCPVIMGGEGATSLLYHISLGLKATRIIETGVAFGWSSLAMLLAIKDIPGAKLISNDMPYIKMNNDDFVGCIIPEELKSKWELQRLPDIKGIPLAIKKLNGEIDLCHYDSDKSYTGRMFAYPLLWNALKENGIFISDDIQDNLAFKNFAESVNKSPLVFEFKNKYVGLLKK